MPKLAPEHTIRLLVRQLVGGDAEGFVAVLLRVEERLSGENAAVVAGDELERFRVASRVFPGCCEQFAGEVGGEVVHEGDGTEDGPGHCARCGFRGLGLKVLFNVVFGDEVGYICRCGLGFLAAAFSGREDEVRDP